MHNFRLYTATEYSFISIGSLVKGELCLQDSWTDSWTKRQGDSYISPPKLLSAWGEKQPVYKTEFSSNYFKCL